jgi:hypothetical protein
MTSNISNSLSTILDILKVSTDDKTIIPLGLLTKKITNTMSFLSVHPLDIIEQPVFFFFSILACTPQASSLLDPFLASNTSLYYHGKMEASNITHALQPIQVP